MKLVAGIDALNKPDLFATASRRIILHAAHRLPCLPILVADDTIIFGQYAHARLHAPHGFWSMIKTDVEKLLEWAGTGKTPAWATVEEIAAFRLINECVRAMTNTAIPTTSALSAQNSKCRELALLRGCNFLMPSMTQEEHRADYNIYLGKNQSDTNISDSLTLAKANIRSLGLVPSTSKGFSPRSHNVHESTSRSATGHSPRRKTERGQVIAN
jgi:hypothetical protein